MVTDQIDMPQRRGTPRMEINGVCIPPFGLLGIFLINHNRYDYRFLTTVTTVNGSPDLATIAILKGSESVDKN